MPRGNGDCILAGKFLERLKTRVEAGCVAAE